LRASEYDEKWWTYIEVHGADEVGQLQALVADEQLSGLREEDQGH
jgi:hypothetical protein